MATLIPPRVPIQQTIVHEPDPNAIPGTEVEIPKPDEFEDEPPGDGETAQ